MLELQGMIVPLVTPFDSHDAIDGPALISVAERARSHGASGLMLTALTGEGPLLSANESETVWRTVMERYRGEMPIIPAIFPTTTVEAIRLGTLASNLGASAIMVAAIMPELYGRRAHEHVLRFFQTFCGAVPLPVVLFNYPSVAGYDLTPDLVLQLAEISNIWGIKESTGDSRRVSEILYRSKGRIKIVCGAPDVALESLALGSEAWITAITNVVPAASRALIDAMQARDLAKARELNYRVIRPMFDLIRESSNTIGTIKAGLVLRGIKAGAPRPPGLPLPVDRKLQTAFEDIFRVETQLLS